MIKSLYLKNFALIQEIQIFFENGLNVITGETGTGKSLLLKSLRFLNGERFSKEFIREGEDRCILEVEYKNDITTIIRRVFHSDGRSRSFINDEPVSVEKLKEFSHLFLNYHGQNENQKLFEPLEQLKILDHFANVEDKVLEINSYYKQINKNKKLIEQLDNKIQNFNREQEIVEYQLNEITQSEFQLEDDLLLSRKIKKISNQSEIKNKLKESINLYKIVLYEKLHLFRRNLNYISNIDNDFKKFMLRLDEVIFEFDDIVNEMKNEVNEYNQDKDNIGLINETLSYLEMLKRKYGGSLEAVLEYKNDLIKRVKDNSTINEDLEKLKINTDKQLLRYEKLSNEISTDRVKCIPSLIKLIEKNLSSLGMENTKFLIKLSNVDLKIVSPYGNNRCDFQITSHKSGEYKSLRKVASGGEISRIQLAIKMLKVNSDLNETIIFDEIDSGISGRIADMTGMVMKKLSKFQQIICITHLPQIAGKGDHHFVTTKKLIKKGTQIVIKKLNNDEKIEEIASLMSGNEITKLSKAQAKEILKV